MKICSVRAELFHADGWGDRQTDRQTDRETNNGVASRASQFCEGV